MTDGDGYAERTPQATLDGQTVQRPTCEPPHYPDRDCGHLVDRVITVYYGGPASTTIEWQVCEEHADEVRDTGEVRDERSYREHVDGFSEVEP